MVGFDFGEPWAGAVAKKLNEQEIGREAVAEQVGGGVSGLSVGAAGPPRWP